MLEELLSSKKGQLSHGGSINAFWWTKKLMVSSTHTCATRRIAELVGNTIIHLLQRLIDLLHIITGDKGKEFADHEHIDKDFTIDFFLFAIIPLRSGAPLRL